MTLPTELSSISARRELWQGALNKAKLGRGFLYNLDTGLYCALGIGISVYQKVVGGLEVIPVEHEEWTGTRTIVTKCLEFDGEIAAMPIKVCKFFDCSPIGLLKDKTCLMDRDGPFNLQDLVGYDESTRFNTR